MTHMGRNVLIEALMSTRRRFNRYKGDKADKLVPTLEKSACILIKS